MCVVLFTVYICCVHKFITLTHAQTHRNAHSCVDLKSVQYIYNQNNESAFGDPTLTRVCIFSLCGGALKLIFSMYSRPKNGDERKNRACHMTIAKTRLICPMPWGRYISGYSPRFHIEFPTRFHNKCNNNNENH